MSKRDQEDPATRPARATSLETRHRPGFVTKPELQEKLEAAEAEATRLREAMARSQIATDAESTKDANTIGDLSRKIDYMADAMLKQQQIMQVLLEEREAKMKPAAEAAQTPLHADARAELRGAQTPYELNPRGAGVGYEHQPPGLPSAQKETLEAKTPISDIKTDREFTLGSEYEKVSNRTLSTFGLSPDTVEKNAAAPAQEPEIIYPRVIRAAHGTRTRESSPVPQFDPNAGERGDTDLN